MPTVIYSIYNVTILTIKSYVDMDYEGADHYLQGFYNDLGSVNRARPTLGIKPHAEIDIFTDSTVKILCPIDAYTEKDAKANSV